MRERKKRERDFNESEAALEDTSLSGFTEEKNAKPLMAFFLLALFGHQKNLLQAGNQKLSHSLQELFVSWCMGYTRFRPEPWKLF